MTGWAACRSRGAQSSHPGGDAGCLARVQNTGSQFVFICISSIQQVIYRYKRNHSKTAVKPSAPPDVTPPDAHGRAERWGWSLAVERAS